MAGFIRSGVFDLRTLSSTVASLMNLSLRIPPGLCYEKAMRYFKSTSSRVLHQLRDKLI